jgi:hypothetical protein
MSKLEEIANLFRFSFKKSKDFKMKLQGSEKGQKGQNQNRHSSPENRAPKSQQFKGVRQRKWGKWVSKIRIPNSNSRIWLGSYDTPEKATRAYDFAAYCLRGSKARLNFPVYPPEIPHAPFLTRPQIQSAAAKFAAEEFRPPSEVGVASSSSHLEAECGMDGQQITVEQSPASRVSVPLECLHSGESLNVEDIPLLDVSMENFGVLFQPSETNGQGVSDYF